jgi:hypothetical protein
MRSERRSGAASPYVAPREPAKRRQCVRPGADRSRGASGLMRVCLGDGKNAVVRYIREEVIAYEQSRRVSLTL